MAIEGKKIIPPYAPIVVPLPIPSENWNDAPLWCLQVNAKWGAYVLGVLEALGQQAAWIGDAAEVDAVLEQVSQLIDAFMDGSCGTDMIQIFADDVEMTLWGFVDSPSGGKAFVPVSSQILAGYWRNANHADGDGALGFVLLGAGTYKLHIIGTSASNQGKQVWGLNGVYLDLLDWYSAATTSNVEKTINGVVVPTDGVQVIEFAISGKNASSSNFYYALSMIRFEKS